MGPKNDNIIGYNIMPFNMPNKIIADHVLKTTMKMNDLPNPVKQIAMKVEKPPWNTAFPI